jgi:hypothetical protein
MDVLVKDDSRINDRLVRRECGASKFGESPRYPSEDIGETIIRGGELSPTVSFEAHRSNLLCSEALTTFKNPIEMGPLSGQVFTSTRPRLLKSIPESTDDENVASPDQARGSSQKNRLNAIDRLFNGLI